MTVSVRFKESIVTDAEHPITLEGAIRQIAVLAGIHDFAFQDDVEEAFTSLSSWTTDTTDGTAWVVATGELVVTGGGNAVWYEGIHDTEVSPSFLANFDLVTGSGAFVFRAKTGASDCYIAWWDGSNCGFAKVNSSKASTDLIKMPFGISGPARVQVEVRWKLDSVNESRKWLLMALIVDGREVAAFAEDVGGTVYDWSGDGIGFAVTGANSLTVDNLTISELHRSVDYITLDPGQPIASGLAQAIGTTKTRSTIRFDGTMRVWLPGNRSVDWTVPSGRDLQFSDRRVITSTATRIRSIGAFHQEEYSDDDEGQVHMNRFSQSDDPNLASHLEVYDEARRQVRDAKEAQKPMQLALYAQPLLEPYDIVSYDSTSYRVLAMNSQVSARKAGTVYVSTVEGQEYIAI